eukprot:scaffold140484_cov19-Tisochrysis_lutea.AAC.1
MTVANRPQSLAPSGSAEPHSACMHFAAAGCRIKTQESLVLLSTMQVQRSAKRARNALGGPSTPAPRILMASPPNKPQQRGCPKKGRREKGKKDAWVWEQYVLKLVTEQSQQQQQC